MSPAEFEPAIPSGERPQTYALHRTAIGIGQIRTPNRPARNLVGIPTTLPNK